MHIVPDVFPMMETTPTRQLPSAPRNSSRTRHSPLSSSNLKSAITIDPVSPVASPVPRGVSFGDSSCLSPRRESQDTTVSGASNTSDLSLKFDLTEAEYDEVIRLGVEAIYSVRNRVKSGGIIEKKGGYVLTAALDVLNSEDQYLKVKNSNI